MQTIRKVIVTGGAGFIGSHITEELLRLGCKVLVIDNLSTGKIENIKDILKNPNFQFIQGSITDVSLLNKLFSGSDYVFHQAAIPNVIRSIEDPVATHEANVTGTLNVLTAARDNSIKKVIFASSSAIFGDTSILSQKEDMLPNPQSPYAVSKLASEYYCQVFNLVYKLPTVCLRYFNVYGPRQDPNSQYSAVIPKFIQRILTGKSPIIFGDGEQTRDFVFVRDVVSANLLAVENDSTGIFNIGSGQKVSINQLVRWILKLLNIDNIETVYEKERSGEIKHSLADISKAKTLAYQPKFSLEAGLKETIEKFKNTLK
jgi:UDP-glucose 4-epimerase